MSMYLVKLLIYVVFSLVPYLISVFKKKPKPFPKEKRKFILIWSLITGILSNILSFIPLVGYALGLAWVILLLWSIFPNWKIFDLFSIFK